MIIKLTWWKNWSTPRHTFLSRRRMRRLRFLLRSRISLRDYSTKTLASFAKITMTFLREFREFWFIVGIPSALPAWKSSTSTKFVIFRKRRVRCPMCLKLVKQLDSLERLPINHTIFTHLVEKEKKQCEIEKRKPAIKDASKYLFSEFERVQK